MRSQNQKMPRIRHTSMLIALVLHGCDGKIGYVKYNPALLRSHAKCSAYPFVPFTVPNENYNGTTCENMCCKKAEATGPSSWQFPANPLHMPCSNNSNTNCTWWVPCEANNRNKEFFSDGYLSSFFIILAVCIFVLICSACSTTETQDRNYDANQAMLSYFSVMSIIVYCFAIIAISNYDYWASQTEVNLEIASKQSCTAACEDTCELHTDDWVLLKNTITFLRIRTYINVCVLIVLIVLDIIYYTKYSTDTLKDMQSYLYIACSIASFCFFVCDCFFIGKFDTHSGLKNYLQQFPCEGQFIPVTAHSVCSAFVAYDLVSIFTTVTFSELRKLP